ncbi:MAG: intramembrane metalloprotease PrsW, partial [Lysinibacillus sp.]|nr:intramembrane metalloprotease PrsW [Lysinibacillus sp.]
SYFYLRNQMSTEPRRTLFRTFIFGLMITFPIMFIQFVMQEEGIVTNPFLVNVVISCTLEEFFKWFIIFALVYRHVEFDDPYDGILYGAAASLGFATVENILYLLTFGIDTAFMRALLPVSSHALFGVVMGYYFGKSKFSTNNRSLEYLVLSFFIPFLLHIIYNAIMMFEGYWVYLIAPFMLFLWWLALKKVKLAHEHLIRHLMEQNKI